jgi:hypothetical protein
MTAAFKAGAAYFIVVYLIGFVLGTIRVLLLMPRVGETTAVLFEAPIILTASWIASRWSVNRFDVPAETAPRLAMGGIAFVLLTIGELAVSLLVFGRAWGDVLPVYQSTPGIISLAAQAAFALLPFTQAIPSRRQ